MPPGTTRQALVEVYSRAHPIWAAIPIETVTGGTYTYTREQTLPGIAFRGVNEAFTESTGITNPLVETLAFGGGDIFVDKAIIRVNGEQVRARQEAMKLKALAHKMGDTFINGNSLTSPKEFDGLARRLGSSVSSTGQILSEGATDGGDPLQASSLDRLVDMVDEPTHLIMSRAMRRRIVAGSRSSSVLGDVQWDLDAVGRKIAKYNDIPILLSDENASLYTSLDFNELGGAGSTATASSIYCVSLKPGRCFAIWSGPPLVTRLPETASGATPGFGTRFEVDIGMVVEHPYAAARLRNISDAAMIA
jgi:hypothetical protein